jgi:ABC-type sugar transport systems, permease components
MQLFDQVFIMTDGGPGNSTYVPLIYIYNQAFVFDNFGAAAAASFILFVIILILTLAQRRLISEVRWA